MTDLKYEVVNETIALITLNRPEASNAMSLTLLNELNDVIDTINNSDKIQCVIITGAGMRAFCAGADLKERKSMSERAVLKQVNYISDTICKIESIKVPVIALINGAAIGGGLELALACDIRLAYRHATFGLTETSLAIIPGAGGTQRLSRLIGIGQAKRLIFSSKLVDATEALSIGLIEEIVDETVMIEQIEIIKSINNNGPLALKQAKKAINLGLNVSLQAGLDIEQLCYQSIIYSQDRTEGLKAFAEKRKPIYRGK